MRKISEWDKNTVHIPNIEIWKKLNRLNNKKKKFS